MAKSNIKVAIVDFDLGNLFSVAQACRMANINAVITHDAGEIATADGLILPGVGGFPRAMSVLRQRGLISAIKDVAASGRPVVGICLGMQLLLQSSTEFGHTDGLGLIAGNVDRLPEIDGANGRNLPDPNVGWSTITPAGAKNSWSDTPLSGTSSGASFYFVHSYYAKPEKPENALANSRFGDFEYCAAIRNGQTFGFQFHPERSGEIGLNVYRTLARTIFGSRVTP